MLDQTVFGLAKAYILKIGAGGRRALLSALKPYGNERWSGSK